MATLLNKTTGERVTLMVHHVLGRHPDTSNTVLPYPDASRMHAVITWDEDFWYLKDTSANGTFINGERVFRDSKKKLKKRDKISFGSMESDCWELVDDDEPQSMLLPITPGLDIIALTGMVALPSEEQPEITIYQSSEGLWICESPAGTNTLTSGDIVGNHEKTWRFVDCTPTTKTQANMFNALIQPADISFLFTVSQNEEHVSVDVNVKEETIALGERSHHYLLLLLARKRLEDQDQGLADGEQGWISKDGLSKMLGLSEHHINIQIYRFRKQVVNALPQSTVLHQTIERRSGELRFSYSAVKIEGGLQAP